MCESVFGGGLGFEKSEVVEVLCSQNIQLVEVVVFPEHLTSTGIVFPEHTLGEVSVF